MDDGIDIEACGLYFANDAGEGTVGIPGLWVPDGTPTGANGTGKGNCA